MKQIQEAFNWKYKQIQEIIYKAMLKVNNAEIWSKLPLLLWHQRKDKLHILYNYYSTHSRHRWNTCNVYNIKMNQDCKWWSYFLLLASWECHEEYLYFVVLCCCPKNKSLSLAKFPCLKRQCFPISNRIRYAVPIVHCRHLMGSYLFSINFYWHVIIIKYKMRGISTKLETWQRRYCTILKVNTREYIIFLNYF